MDGRIDTVEGSVAEQFKVLTCNPEVLSSSPLPASHAGVNSLLGPAFLQVEVFNPFNVCSMALKSSLWGAVIKKFYFFNR